MPNQTRHDLRKPGIRLGARCSDDRVGEVRVEARDFGGVGSVGGSAVITVAISRDTWTGLVGDKVQRLVDIHGVSLSLRGCQAGADREVVGVWRRRGEEEVFDREEDEEEGVGLGVG
jgi:hypothetical protein